MLRIFDRTSIGFISALAGFTSFSIADASAKWLGGYYSTFDVIFWTYLLSLIFGLLLSPWLGGIKATFKTEKLLVHLGRGVCSLGIAACVIKAMSLGLPLANMYTILFLSPFLITLCAWPIYKEPVRFKNLGIIILGFCGILIAYPPGVKTIGVEEFYAIGALGFILCLSLLARLLDDPKENIHALSFYPAIVTIAIVTPLLWPNIAFPRFDHWGVFALNGLAVTVGLSGIAYGFRLAPYALVAPIHYIQMVVALVAGYVIFGDVPDGWMVGGACVIIASGVWLVWSKRGGR